MIERLELDKSDSISVLGTFENELQHLYDEYKSVVRQNEFLQKEIKRVKDEKFADEELSMMKTQYEDMKTDYYRGFPITEEEERKIKEWKSKQTSMFPGHGGAIGGRFIYKFQPTGIGTIGTIVDSVTGNLLTFKELD